MGVGVLPCARCRAAASSICMKLQQTLLQSRDGTGWLPPQEALESAVVLHAEF